MNLYDAFSERKKKNTKPHFNYLDVKKNHRGPSFVNYYHWSLWAQRPLIVCPLFVFLAYVDGKVSIVSYNKTNVLNLTMCSFNCHFVRIRENLRTRVTTPFVRFFTFLVSAAKRIARSSQLLLSGQFDQSELVCRLPFRSRKNDYPMKDTNTFSTFVN